MSYSDADIKKEVQKLFDQYDKDKSGTLEINQVTLLINDTLKKIGHTRQVSQAEMKVFITAYDKNADGKLGKAELYEILKRVISKK